jgi:hypothetical protein
VNTLPRQQEAAARATHTDVALLSETHLKQLERGFIPNYHIYRADRIPDREGGTAVAVRKGISSNHVQLPHFFH